MSQRAMFSARRLLGCIGASLVFAAASMGARAQSAAPADTTKIVIGEPSTGTGQLPIYVALQQGFFQKAGLDVTGQLLSGGTASAMAAFASGSVNILNLSAPEVVQYVGKKVISGKAFAEIVDQSYDVVTAKSITNVQDIKGKAVGISAPNAGDYVLLLATMQQYGIAPKDVTFINSGNSINRLAALNAGSIQVAAESNSLRDQSMKAGNVLIKSGDNPAQFPTTVFVASSDLINNHKPLLKKFVGALSDATKWIQANPDAAVPICTKALGATTEDCTTAIAFYFNHSVSGKYTWSSTYALSLDGIKSALAVVAIMDPETKNLTVDDVADTSIAGTTP
jgi:NitT/TauT family transport system substrate-binding protein